MPGFSEGRTLSSDGRYCERRNSAGKKRRGGRVNTKSEDVLAAKGLTQVTRKLWIKEGGIEKIRRRVLSWRLIAGAWVEDQ